MRNPRKLKQIQTRLTSAHNSWRPLVAHPSYKTREIFSFLIKTTERKKKLSKNFQYQTNIQSDKLELKRFLRNRINSCSTISKSFSSFKSVLVV